MRDFLRELLFWLGVALYVFVGIFVCVIGVALLSIAVLVDAAASRIRR